MASAVLAFSNSQTADEANRTRFDEICALATDFAKRDIKAKEVLYRALDALFSFVLDFDSDADRKAFVIANAGKWGKIADDNPFQPFVKLAFRGDGISDGSRSQYATVLRYAQFYRDKSISLAEWLGQPGGLEQRYKQAANATLSKQRFIDPACLDRAKLDVKAARRSDAFRLDALPVELDEVEGGFAIALLHIAPDGTAHVVEYTERDQTKIDAIIAGLATGQARKQTVETRPLYRLRRALNVLSTLVPPGKTDMDVIFVLRKSDVEGDVCSTLQAMSSAYSGPLGQIQIDEHFAWLVDDVPVVFTHSTARAFDKGFDVEGHWLGEVEDGHVLISHSHADVQPVAIPTMLPAGDFYVPRSDFSQSAPMILKLEGARSYLAGKNGKCPVRGAYAGALPMFWDNGYLCYRAAPTWPAVHGLFAVHADPALPAERLFPAEALTALCSVSDVLGQDLSVWLISTPEEADCALVLDDTVEGDALQVVLPLSISVRGDLTQTNIASPSIEFCQSSVIANEQSS